MHWATVKQRVADSAIEVALGAFWVAVWGALVSACIWTYLFFEGTSASLLIALGSIAATFLFVVLFTAAIVLVKKRGKRTVLAPVRVGRKGFLDYKIQGQRALVRMTGSLGSMTRLMGAIGRDATVGARRAIRAQRGWGNTDERAYRVTERTAQRLDKRGTAMRLHADQYSADVRLFVEGFSKWTEWVAAEENVDRAQLLQVAAMFDGMRVAAESQLPHMQQFMVIIEETRQTSERMDLAGQSLTEAVTVVIESAQQVIVFCDKHIALLREKAT